MLFNDDVHRAFFSITGHLPRNGPTHSGLVLPTSILSQDTAPQKFPQVNLMEAILT